MSVENLVLIAEGLAYTSGATKDVKIPNNVSFSEIIIQHNTGTLSGGSSGDLIANTILEWLRINIQGEFRIDIIGDADSDAVPWAIQLLREANKLANKGQADTAEFFRIRFPDAQGVNHNAYIDFKWRAIADINDGDRTTYTGTIDVYAITKDKLPGRIVKMVKNCGKFNYGTNAGYLDNYINPSLLGYRATGLLAVVEDDGTASDTAIAKIILKRGTKTIVEGSVAKLRMQAQAIFKTATSTGFVYIPLNDRIGSNDLLLKAYISSGGTNVELHWMLTSVSA